MCDNDDDNNRWESVSDYGTRLDMFAYSDSEFDEEYDDFDEENYFDMAGSLVEVLGTTPRMGRRSMALADIDPKYVSQSGIWEASEVETSRGSIRIQHLTAPPSGPRPLSCTTSIGSGPGPSRAVSRFPKLEECAHFHYDILELPLLKIRLRDEPNKYTGGEETSGTNSCGSVYNFSIEVVSSGQSWTIKRTHSNFRKLDEQLHRCVWDRSFSQLHRLTHLPQFQSEHVQNQPNETSKEEQNECQRELIEEYLERLSQLPTNQITCGTVLSWLEIDNRGRHIVSSDDSAINTPAVAAACAIRQYIAQASDELSFEIGDMISVIDMPPPEESSWWRGKRRFTVGFFPRDCVQVIGEKVPSGLPSTPSSRKQQRLSALSSVSSSTVGSSMPDPDKPVLRKHGKLISFFRSFILSRPSRRRLRQTGILRERVFGCDLAEHLLNTGSEIPDVLKCCAEFIELEGIVDGIYRVSGITSNIQKLRNAFDEDRIPNLEEDEAIKQDIHAVSSLLKMYFRELPNPLCTYQLYNKFREAIEACDEERLLNMREVAQELPPPHYRTLEYLLKHLARVAEQNNQTGMTIRNIAIVWAPNLIRCKDLEAGGVTALKGIGVQAIVTEYLIRHADLIFNDKFSEQITCSSKELKSLPLSPPIKYVSLDGDHDPMDDDRKYIEVGGGPSSLPEKYHTVIDIRGRRSSLKSKRSAAGWRTFFSRNRSFSKPHRKASDIIVGPPMNVQHLQTNWPPQLPLRPVKSIESLIPLPLYDSSNSYTYNKTPLHDIVVETDETLAEVEANFKNGNASAQAEDNEDAVSNGSELSEDSLKLQNPKTHNRSISHDSYFEFGEFLKKTTPYIDEIIEEDDGDEESKISIETSTNGCTSSISSPRKEFSSGILADSESTSSRLKQKFAIYNLMIETVKIKNGSEQKSDIGNTSSLSIPPTTSGSSIVQQTSESAASAMSSSSDDPPWNEGDETVLARSPLLKPKPRYSILRNAKHSETETSLSKLIDPDTSSSHYSEGEASSSEIHRSYENALNTCHVFKDLCLPLEHEASKLTCGIDLHEIDRNSSIDNSSTDTTPGCDPQRTNIIYSPLVNESQVSPGYDKRNVPAPFPSSSLFVCPLYESGPKIETSTAEVTSLRGTGSQQKTTSLEPKKSFKTQIRQYQNIEILVPSTEEDCFISNEESDILWNEGRIYQNIGRHLISEPLDELYLQQEVRVIHVDGNSVQPPEDTTNEEYNQHYENVSSRGITSPDADDDIYGTNIYEDIEDDDDGTNVSHQNSKTDEPPSLPDRNHSPDHRASRMSNASDISAGEAYESVQFGNSSVPPLLSPVTQLETHDETENDCYAEVGLQKIANQGTFHEISSPSLDSLKTESSLVSPQSEEQSMCQTEDVVTYLEMDTGKRNNSQQNSDSQEELESELCNDSTSAGVTPTLDEEIRHIDSPLIVGNPLYGVEFELSGSGQRSTNGKTTDSTEKREKLIGRSNSVPLTDHLNNSLPENGNIIEVSSQPSSIPEQNINDARKLNNSKDVNIVDAEMLLLWKRLSEPSLSQSKKEDKAAALEAWKLADAKRLAHRKQSVKELLTKFEPRESISPSPSPTNNLNWKNARNSPGLPRPDSKNSNSSRQQNTSKFQHHRFSIGDILMSQSLTSADKSDQSSGYSLMSRSDTYPELRTESTKENESTPEIQVISQVSPVQAPEKLQSALRVAMSSVDMNDPTTRERIEKYKEERRLFLRQKIGTELVEPKLSSSISSNEPSHNMSTSNFTLAGIFDRSSSTCSSDSEVFLAANLRNVKEESKACMESPRKRAFSEDVTQANYHTNQNKAIKTEMTKIIDKSLQRAESDPPISTLSVENVQLVTEEINVREKVALWSTGSSVHNQDRKPYCSPYANSLQRPLYKMKPPLVEACSLPIEGTSIPKKLSAVTPTSGLRREQTTGSIDMNKAKMISRTPGGNNTDSSKKIKDMAAFFEGKHF